MQAVFGLIRTMSPRQWAKNLLFMFPPLVFDGQLFILESFLSVSAAFFMFCMISGTVYIINDLVGIESDRQHPRKKCRTAKPSTRTYTAGVPRHAGRLLVHFEERRHLQADIVLFALTYLIILYVVSEL